MTIHKLSLLCLCLFIWVMAYPNNEQSAFEDSISVDGFNCPDNRFVTYSVVSLTTQSIKFKIETSQNLPLRMRYYPTSNPAAVQFNSCEPSLNYGANGNEHIQTLNGLTAATEYTIIFQTAQNNSANSADCPILAWEDISCPITLETLSGNSTNCSGESPLAIGLPYLAWSLNNQRMRDDKTRVAWTFKAERTETLTELALNQRVGTNYSSGNGGFLKYKFYSGALPNIGGLIYESGNIVAHTNLYGPRPANTVQPSRSVGNASYQPFPVQVPVVEGQFYTVVIERQGSAANHISINGFILPDENRDFLYPGLGLLDPIEWKIYVQATGSSNWVRRPNNIALFSLGRADGTGYGNNYAEELAAPESDRMYNLSGSKRFRLNLNLPSAMSVDKIGMGLVRRSGTEPVIVNIKDASGTSLSTHSFDFSNLPIPGPNNTNLAENDWLLRHGRIVTLDIEECLPAGQLYLEVQTGSNSNFEIAGLRDGSASGFFLPATIDNGYMEISTNSGATWSKPQQWSNTNVITVQPSLYIYGELCSTNNCQPTCYSNAGTGTTVSLCDTVSISTLNLFSELTGNPETTGVWTDLDNTNALTGGILNLSALPAGVYRFSYVVSNALCEADSSEVIVEIQGCSPCSIFKPQIDANQEAGWNTISLNTITNNIVGTVTGNADLSAYYKIHWDADNLYLLVDVTDDALVNDNSSNFVHDDGVSLYLDGGNEKGTSYDANDHNFTFRWNDSNIRYGSTTNPVGAVKAESQTATGYLMEVSISWSLIGVTPLEGNSIGIDVHVNDDDDGGLRDKKLTWFGLVDQAYYNPSVLGNYTLPDVCGRRVTCQVSLLLEGAFDSNTGLQTTEMLQSDILPSGQPYDQSPWNYTGSEGDGWSTSDYPSGSVDWVLLSFRESPQAGSEVARGAAVLLDDGTVLPIDLEVPDGVNVVYLVVHHRNHLPVMSPTPIDISTDLLSFDFRQVNSYENGGFGQKQIGSQWMMYAGNGDHVNAFGSDINAIDKVLWESENGSVGKYLFGDHNLDGDVNGADNLLWKTNNGIYSHVH